MTSSGPLMVAIGRQGGEHIIVAYGVEPTSEAEGDMYVCDPWHGNGAVVLGEFQRIAAMEPPASTRSSSNP